MRLKSDVLLFVATFVSVSLAAIAVALALYIACSLVTQAGYREMFLAYALKLIALYSFFALGVAATAVIALRFPQSRPGNSHPWLWSATFSGVVSAALLEFTFWPDLGDHFAHGAVFLPFVCWAFVVKRSRHAA